MSLKTKRKSKPRARPKVTPEFINALGHLLGEFGSVDLEPRLKYFRGEGDDEAAEWLEEAFDLVAKWHAANVTRAPA
jgi:hypothetical protein